MADNLIRTLADFRIACEAHDLTFRYSDSNAAYVAGSEDYVRIRAAARNFAPDHVRRIWNDVVDSKINPAYRHHFYWRELHGECECDFCDPV